MSMLDKEKCHLSVSVPKALWIQFAFSLMVVQTLPSISPSATKRADYSNFKGKAVFFVFFSAVIQKKENETMGQIDPSSRIALGYVVETI